MSLAPNNSELHAEYTLTPAQITQFQRDGYIKLKEVLSPEVLDYYGKEIVRLVMAQTKDIPPLEERTTYGKAFLQITNLWLRSEIVRDFVFSKRLARIATELLRTRGVGIYHDQALCKESGGGHTPWHVDQFYWPLATGKTVTAWIPLHAVPLEQGPLMFAVGSHRIKTGRDLEISDLSERKAGEHLKISELPIDETPFDLGEVSFHLGYTFHRAGSNKTAHMREVMTVIYMDEDMRLAEPKNKNQENMWRDLINYGVSAGDVIRSPINPVVYSRRRRATP
jgi:ectoine hydroxylase-related dioxygenase (phytanoyl-CoA dioxygenase family)